MSDSAYTVVFAEPHTLTDGDQTELEISEYDDFGSMIQMELTDGSTRSVGKQLITEIIENN
jgi:hypothetical protein